MGRTVQVRGDGCVRVARESGARCECGRLSWVGCAVCACIYLLRAVLLPAPARGKHAHLPPLLGGRRISVVLAGLVPWREQGLRGLALVQNVGGKVRVRPRTDRQDGSRRGARRSATRRVEDTAVFERFDLGLRRNATQSLAVGGVCRARRGRRSSGRVPSAAAPCEGSSWRHNPRSLPWPSCS